MDGAATLPQPSGSSAITAKKPRNHAQEAIDFFPLARQAIEQLQPFNPNTPSPGASEALIDPSTLNHYGAGQSERPEPHKLKRLLKPTTHIELKRGSELLGYESPSERIKIKQHAVKEAIEDSLMEEHLTFEDLKPYRIKTCYRLTRYMILLLNAGSPLETISSLITQKRQDNVDPTVNYWYLRRDIPRTYKEPAKSQLLRLNLQISGIRQCVSGFTPKLSLFPPLPLPPEKWPVFSAYDPHVHEPELALHTRILNIIAEGTGIAQSTGRNPNEARYGMTGVTDPWMCRIAWPDPLELVQYEQDILEQTSRRLIRNDVLNTVRHLTQVEGFNEDEARSIVNLSRHSLGNMLTNNEAINRNLLVLRLESMWKRAKMEGNFKAESEALKMMAVIQGLTTSIKDDLMTSFMEAAKKYTNGTTSGSDQDIIDAEVSQTVKQIESLPFYPKGVQVPPPAQVATKPKD